MDPMYIETPYINDQISILVWVYVADIKQLTIQQKSKL